MRGFRAFFMGRLCASKELSWESEVLTQTTEELGSAARQERIEGVYERVREVQRAAGYHGPEALGRLSERRKRCGRGKRRLWKKSKPLMPPKLRDAQLLRLDVWWRANRDGVG